MDKKKKKGCLIGCLTPVIMIAVMLIIAAMVDAGNKKDKEVAVVDNDWITVTNFEITDEHDLETKALYTILNTFEPNERVTNTGASILEKEATIWNKVEIKEIDELSVFKEGTNSLTLTMRSNRFDSVDKTIEDTREKTIQVLKNIGPFMKENNISGIQIEWTLPKKLSNGTITEPIYYTIRFDIDMLLKLDWNTVTPDNVESYAMYAG